MKKIIIFTGYNCNENCFFCSAEVHGKKHINISTRMMLKKILSWSKQGAKALELIGGEVLIRKDIDILIAFWKKLWFEKISIETNGGVLSSFQRAERLIRVWLTDITISIHGATPELNDTHTGLKGSFKHKIQALENLKILKKIYNFNVITNYVVTSKNIDCVNDFLDLMGSYNYIQNHIFAFVRPIKSYRNIYDTYLPSFYDIKRVFEWLKSPKVLIQYLPYCVLDERYHKTYLDHFSKWEKSMTTKDNINSVDTLESLIQSEEYYFPECYDCKFFGKCRGVWKEYVNFFWMKSPPML